MVILLTDIPNHLSIQYAGQFFSLSEIAERAINPSVRVGDSDSIATGKGYKLCDSIKGTITAVWTAFCGPPLFGRYVSFHLFEPNTTLLNFREIEVHGYC